MGRALERRPEAVHVEEASTVTEQRSSSSRVGVRLLP
jgi:hypothetical protein